MRDLLAGAGGRVVIYDQNLVDDTCRNEFLDGTTDRIPLVVGRQDQGDFLSLPDGLDPFCHRVHLCG
jgi:hypothetical protein